MHWDRRAKTPENQAELRRLGAGALTEAALGGYIRPLFPRLLPAPFTGIYLANHPRGGLRDRTARDVWEADDAWHEGPDAWDAWLLEWLRDYSRRQSGRNPGRDG